MNHAGQRGEEAFFKPRGLSYLRPPFGKILRRDAMQPVQDQRVPLPEGVRGRR